jgi:hypothetical protein
MSSETRIVRPYVGIDRLTAALDDARLFVGQNEYQSGSSVIVPLESFLMRPVSLVLSPSDDEFEALATDLARGVQELDLAPDDVDVVVVASTPYLKLTEVVSQVRLSKLEEAGRVLLLTDQGRPRPLQTPHGGYSIDVYLALADQREPIALRPWRKGTWLARTRFSVTTDLGSVGFVPRPLTSEVKEELGLPAGAVRYVVLEDETPLLSEVSDDAVQLFVDSDLLAQMSAAPRSPASQAIQLQLFVDAIRAILDAADDDESFQDLMSVADVEGSLLQRIMAMVAGRGVSESDSDFRDRQDEFLKMARTSRARFMAHVEETCRLRGQFLEAVAE